jgi:hypothetical protein
LICWANIGHIFNIRIMNIFDLLFEYSNIIRIFYVIKFYKIFLLNNIFENRAITIKVLLLAKVVGF